MAKPVKHVFVCTQSRPPGHPRSSCGAVGGTVALQEFMQHLEEQQLWGRVAVTGCGCLGTCGSGPSVLVYPEGVMYGGVDKEGVAAIVKEHLLGDQPVARLQVPETVWG